MPVHTQERRPQKSLIPGGTWYERTCVTGGLAVQLAAECIGERLAQAQNLLVSLAGKEDELPPHIGIDPAFSRQSTLYNPEVSSSMDQLCRVSAYSVFWRAFMHACMC